MADKVPVSEILERVKGGDSDAETALVEHFWAETRQIALRELNRYPAGVRHFEGASDIANAALKSALSYVGKDASNVDNQSQFYTLLRTVIKRKVIDAARHESRNVSRRVDIGDLDVEGREKTPPEALSARELEDRLARLAEQVATLLEREEDETKRMIGVLGVLRFYSASQIQEALASAFPDRKVPAKATIHVLLRAIRMRLAKELGEDVGDE